ncbi:MAG: Replication-associated recombination protein A [Firmicutes bacterium ADurb.Bin467]|nr:MAG: Replication-associated recombination protein A [Firmicutes bacterium ADurb.Bin467]
MEDLFSAGMSKLAPLADRMRPRTLSEFLGQEKIVGEGKLLRRAIEADRLTSSIFWGPPGTGKTTLAAVIANVTRAAFVKLNAVTSGVADVREVIKDAESRLKLYGQPTYLLLDECHRWSKAQSDSILPAIERGLIRFIGSTTENPMIAMTPAIVSRCRLFRFEKLSREDVKRAVQFAIADRERGYGKQVVHIDDDALEHIAQVANGDARSALNALELAVLTTPIESDGSTRITLAIAEESIQSRVMQMDESLLYDMLSAFCKSLRGSDSDAALAWFARMNYGGMDPRIVVRRVIAHASEDVGMANPMAMLQAVAAYHALEAIGMPEAKLPIAQAIIAVCESPKSNAVVMAIARAFEDAEKGGFSPVPAHLRDTHYAGASALGSGEGYKYAHDFPGHFVRQQYAPEEAAGFPYYVPSEQGFESEIRRIRESRGVSDPPDIK